ncbi:MAG: hypothetical protein AAGA00_06985 [Pseudomonadota bacterium]
MDSIAETAQVFLRQQMISRPLPGAMRLVSTNRQGESQMDILVIAATIGVFAGMGFVFYRAFRGKANQDTGGT